MDQLEEIRSKIDLVAYIAESVPLKKAGRNFRGLCPFHTEKTPSLMVSSERQIWKCFGCQKGGDVFTFIMEMEKIDFGEALRILAKRVGVTLTSYRPSALETEKETLLKINYLAAEYFHYLLLNHRVGEKALNYILQRGITRESLIEFKIGYAPNLWDGLQKFLVGKKNYKPRDLEKAGLIIISSKSQSPVPNYYDRFRNRLIFPLADHRGNVVGFAGRLLDPDAKEAHPLSLSAQAAGGQAKYVNTPETAIYHKSELLYPLQITKEAIKQKDQAILVEGEIDAISCYQVGIRNVVAIKGSALTEYQARLIRRFTENALLALDADTAGDMASLRGIEVADKVGLNLKILELGKYKDPDEAAQKEPEYLVKKISEAVNVYDYIIDSAFKRNRGATPEEKRKIGAEVLPTIGKIEDEIVKNVFVKKIADRLGVSEESIVLQIEKINSRLPQITPAASPPVIKGKNRRDLLEEYWLALVFQAGLSEGLTKASKKRLVKTLSFRKIVDLLPDFYQKNKKFSSRSFYRWLPAELRDAFDKLYLVDFGERIDDEPWVRREMEKAEAQLRLLDVREELQKTADGLKQPGLAEKQAKLIRDKIRDLSLKLSQLEKTD